MSGRVKTQQIGVVAAITLLIALLFTRDIKGLVKPKAENGKGVPAAQMGQAPAATEINLKEVSETAKNVIAPDLASEITALENTFSSANEQDKAKNARLLAKKWEVAEQAVPSALYLEVAAEHEQSLDSWIAAGDQFLKGFDNTRDSILQPSLLQKANHAFSNALKIDSTSNEARTGIGITIVNGMGMPMQGIAMLMDVVKKDPKNLKAIMSLGTFAIKSGQFDKAIGRFKDAIAIKPTPDAYFYLATAYENLGKNSEAVAAYLESKRLAGNPTLSKFIDERVEALKK